MKVLFALVAFFAAVLCDISEDEIKEAEKRHDFLTKIALECSEQNGVDQETAHNLLLGDLSIRSDEAKCFVHCIFRKEGFLNTADEPQVDYIIDSLVESVKIKRKKLEKIINQCALIKGKNQCDSAFKLLECYLTDKTIKNVLKKTEL